MTDLPKKPRPAWMDFVGWLIATAIFMPIGWWLHANWQLDDWIRATFY